MSNQTIRPLEGMVADSKCYIVAGSFRPNSTGAVDNTLNTGHGFTVARTNAGIYTVTLTEAGYSIIACIPGLQLASVADAYIQCGAIGTGGITVVINLTTGGGTTGLDPASNAANRVHFILILKNSTATY